MAHSARKTKKAVAQKATPKVFYVFNDNSKTMILLGQSGYSPLQDPRLWLVPKGRPVPAGLPVVTRITYVDGERPLRYEVVPTQGEVVYAQAPPSLPEASSFQYAQYRYDPQTGITRLVVSNGPAEAYDPLSVAVIRLQKGEDGERFYSATKLYFARREYHLIRQALVDEALKQIRLSDPLGENMTTQEALDIGKQTGAHYVVIGRVWTWVSGFEGKAKVRLMIYDTQTMGPVGSVREAETSASTRARATEKAVAYALKDWGQ
jgi:hypothetical protein